MNGCEARLPFELDDLTAIMGPESIIPLGPQEARLAVEAPSKRWVLSVQWHPERPENAAPFRPLFADFVRACGEPAPRPSQAAAS